MKCPYCGWETDPPVCAHCMAQISEPDKKVRKETESTEQTEKPERTERMRKYGTRV